jgi:hypothetical protein
VPTGDKTMWVKMEREEANGKMGIKGRSKGTNRERMANKSMSKYIYQFGMIFFKNGKFMREGKCDGQKYW